MSHEATNWAIKQRGLKPATKIVLWHLADRYHNDNGCFPRMDTLARDCEMSVRSVQTHLHVLEAVGLICWENRKTCAGKRTSNRYHFAFEPDFERQRQKLLMEASGKSTSKPTANSRRNQRQELPTNSVTSSLTGKRTTKATFSVSKMNTFFEVLWGEYPKTGKTAKQDAKRRFEQAINDGADPDFIIMAAKRYAAWLNSGGPSDWRPNPKNLCNWLGKGCWDDEIEEDLSEAELRIRALKARETESWGDPC